MQLHVASVAAIYLLLVALFFVFIKQIINREQQKKKYQKDHMVNIRNEKFYSNYHKKQVACMDATCKYYWMPRAQLAKEEFEKKDSNLQVVNDTMNDPKIK